MGPGTAIAGTLVADCTHIAVPMADISQIATDIVVVIAGISSGFATFVHYCSLVS